MKFTDLKFQCTIKRPKGGASKTLWCDSSGLSGKEESEIGDLVKISVTTRKFLFRYESLGEFLPHVDKCNIEFQGKKYTVQGSLDPTGDKRWLSVFAEHEAIQ